MNEVIQSAFDRVKLHNPGISDENAMWAAEDWYQSELNDIADDEREDSDGEDD